MARNVLSALGIGAVLLGLGPAVALAGNRASVKVGFEFVAGAVTLPAGQYEFSFENEGQVVIRGVVGGQSAVVPLLTHLSQRDTKKPVLVFDKEGDASYLSEIYIPGKDGYCLRATTKNHSHVSAQATD